MIVYRFTENVLPNKIDHKFYGNGVFGRGTYFSLDDRSRFGPDQGHYVVHIKYEMDPGNKLTLSAKHVDGLNDGMDLTVTKAGSALLQKEIGFEFDSSKLTALALKLGYDSLELVKYKEDPEGGLQLILLKKPDQISPEPKSMTIIFADRKMRDSVFSKFEKGKIKNVTNGFGIQNIPFSSADALSEILKGIKWPTAAFLVKNAK